MRNENDDEFRLSKEHRAEWTDGETVILRSEDGDVIELEPHSFSRLAEWVNQKNITRHRLYFRNGHKDHIGVGDDTLCHNNVRLPNEDDSPDLRPFAETTEREWRVLLSTGSLCSRCHTIARRKGLLPSVPDGMPGFPCPECGEKTTRVVNQMGLGIAKHEDGTGHDFDFEIFETWRRGGNPEEIESHRSTPAFS
jgi:hypothetical protein